MSEEQRIITAEDLAGGYGASPLWAHAHFNVHKGEFVGVLGPNGAGKTTLFRLLLGMVRPQHGSLTVFGEKPKRGNPRIGYVPQRHDVDKDLRIEAAEIVRLGSCAGAWGFDLPKQTICERGDAVAALGDVDAKELAHRPLGHLSGGELQRVFLAQALSGRPDLLLLDEPLANLDIRRENEMIGLIRRVVRSRDATAMLIAHDINPLLPALDRVMYVANGRIVTGKPEEILESGPLSELYGTPIEVLRDSKGRLAIIGIEEKSAHHD